MNRLVDEAPGRPLATAEALGRIEAALRYAANSVPQDGLESEIEVAGRQMVLDTIADAVAAVAQREKAQKPVAVVA